MTTRHYDASTFVAARPEQVFAYIDDHARLASHMSGASWMMGGGHMDTELDERKGQAVGSHIRMTGRVFGVSVFLDEVVTSRTPPFEKTWETVGTPHLIVVGPYQMGFQIRAADGGSRLHVFIDYELPAGWSGRLLGRLFGGMYAAWCVRQMSTTAVSQFRVREVASAA